MIINFGHDWNPTNPRYVDIKRVENKLKKVKSGTIIRLGGMTDCFQPIEKKYRTTLETIKILGIAYPELSYHRAKSRFGSIFVDLAASRHPHLEISGK